MAAGNPAKATQAADIALDVGHSSGTDGEVCDDGNLCTELGVCATGACQANAVACADDGDACGTGR